MPQQLVEHITEEGDRFMVPVGWVPDDHSARCRSCGALICWLVTAAGKRNPWSQAADASHFSDCGEADSWRRK